MNAGVMHITPQYTFAKMHGPAKGDLHTVGSDMLADHFIMRDESCFNSCTLAAGWHASIHDGCGIV